MDQRKLMYGYVTCTMSVYGSLNCYNEIKSDFYYKKYYEEIV